MGSSSSKVSQAAGSAARQYPKRTPPVPATGKASSSQFQQQASQGPTVKPAPRASSSRNAAINLDASDPDFARHLRTIGPVQPNPTLSSTSTFNTTSALKGSAPNTRPVVNSAIRALEARARLQQQADKEFAEAGKNGRSFLDAYTIRQILVQRDEQGKSAAQIEKSLSLKPGIVDKLGGKGVYGLITEVGRAKKEIDMV